MYIADSGPANIEEINVGKAGGNYGWSIREGTFAVIPDDERQLRVVEYDAPI